MTGLLNDVMHDRADHLDPPLVDLEAITRDGDRRVRRRRTALLGGVAAASVVLVAGSALLGAGRGSAPDADRADVADGTSSAPVALSWVEGSTLRRVGSPDVDLGVEVRAWVWVGEDIVLTDDDHRVLLWTGDALDVIGRTAPAAPDDPEIVSDASFAAWVDEEGRVRRYDVRDAEVVTAPDLPGRRARVTAIDGAQVYAADTAGVYAWQPASPDSYRTISEDPRQVVIDAEGGTLLVADGGRRARVSGPGGDLTITTDSFANLAPDGRHLVSETDDQGVLLDTTTGARVPLDTGYAWALPYQWLDSDSVAVLAFSGTSSGIEEDQPHLLSCAVSTGACGPGQALPARFQLPLGVSFTE
jgi:hypothetical protein